MTAEAGVIGRFLSRHPGPDWSMSIGNLLYDTRQASGRRTDTGRPDPAIAHDEPPIYLGTLGYLRIVDHAGECLRRTSRTSDARAPFLRALELFTDLPEREREALYAFRCAWLVPYDPVTGPARPLPYRFHVSTDGSSPLVRIQDTPWDGDTGLRHEPLATVVDLRALGDTVEAMYARLFDLLAAGDLAVALPGGVAELRVRCAFFHTDLP